MMPQAGGQYVYLRGPTIRSSRFLYGWTLFLVIQTGTIAAVAVAFAKFTGVLVPVAGREKRRALRSPGCPRSRAAQARGHRQHRRC